MAQKKASPKKRERVNVTPPRVRYVWTALTPVEFATRMRDNLGPAIDLNPKNSPYQGGEYVYFLCPNGGGMVLAVGSHSKYIGYDEYGAEDPTFWCCMGCEAVMRRQGVKFKEVK